MNTPPLSLFDYHLFMFLANLRSAVIRCSTWLGLLMALIRFLTLRFASNRTASKVSFGFYAFLVCFTLSSVVSFLNVFRVKIVEVVVWNPNENTERTTVLVIIMTLSFFIASLPAGVFNLMRVIYTDPGFFTPPLTLFNFYLFGILANLRDDVVRCSTWLGVLMAFIRFSVLRIGSIPGVKNFANVSFGFYASFITFILSTSITIFNLFRIKFVEVGNWRAGANCTTQSNQVWILYKSVVSDLFAAENSFLMRLDMALNAFFLKIIPCTLLPILTIFLLMELRRARKAIASASLLVKKQHLSSFVNHFSNIILTTNASVHCFVWLILSKDYRKTVMKILRIGPQPVYSNSIF
ncbi:hypothetical protein CAEBREN_28566 [Caenorhabditis brenneri]|uniref:G-protein coupled receptors family 1 profile domain-containing protein n=1 Tax=Caenorhabditis brenneri TaxID=135651 RepID=G0P0I2_CAEBE|nr:hypothetical protein CAEBREN_28566 [Caenorhabditis brenneri]